MTKLLRWLAASAIGAAIVTATPAAALHAACMRPDRQVSAGGFHNPACFRHHRRSRNVVFFGEPLFYNYVPYYYVPYYYHYVLYDGNYCWQQIWTASGWQWVDACPGYHGYAY